jgi:hypothetical protein
MMRYGHQVTHKVQPVALRPLALICAIHEVSGRGSSPVARLVSVVYDNRRTGNVRYDEQLRRTT